MVFIFPELFLLLFQLIQFQLLMVLFYFLYFFIAFMFFAGLDVFVEYVGLLAFEVL